MALLKTKVAAFAAGALTVSMIPIGLANGDFSGMFNLTGDAETHVEADGSNDSVMLHHDAETDVSGDVHADHDNHGATVSAVARQKTDVDGEVGTHGKTVSAVARQKTDAAAHVTADEDEDVSDDVDANAHISAHADGNVSVDADDDSVTVNGSANANASADADASHDDDEGGLLDGLLDKDEEESNDDEDDDSGNMLDDLGLDLL